MSDSTQIVPYSPRNESPWLPPHWPNRQTAVTAILIFTNIMCQTLKSSSATTLQLNTPLRLISLGQACYQGKTYKIALDVLAIGALFFPHGRLIAIGLDFISEAINFYTKPKCNDPVKDNPNAPYQLKKRVDPTIYSNALLILKIPEDKAHNIDLIKKNHDEMCSFYEVRIEQLSPFFADALKLLLADVKTAYETLTKDLQHEKAI